MSKPKETHIMSKLISVHCKVPRNILDHIHNNKELVQAFEKFVIHLENRDEELIKKAFGLQMPRISTSHPGVMMHIDRDLFYRGIRVAKGIKGYTWTNNEGKLEFTKKFWSDMYNFILENL